MQRPQRPQRMQIDFVLGHLRITGTYRPSVPGRRRGHPDLWTEDEPEEIEILSVEGETEGEYTDRDLEDAVRDEAQRVVEDRRDAWFAREE